MRKFTVFIIALLFFWLSPAQNKNLNPTVSVTNAYAGKVSDAERETVKIEVPDSVYEFNLKFDYEGFEKQYRGNDEFNPYFTELAISGRPLPEGRKFYMKAGAGYTLHPLLDLVWSVNPDDRCKVGVYASHKSYFGTYDKGPVGIVSDMDKLTFDGYDSKSSAGVNARIDWEKLFLSMKLSYEGVHSKEHFSVKENINEYNSAGFSLRLKSNTLEGVSKCSYDISADYSFGKSRRGDFSKRLSLTDEHNASYAADVSFIGGRSSFQLLSTGTFTSGASSFGSYDAYSLSLSPRYVFNDNGIYLGVGLCLMYASGDNVGKIMNSKGDKEKFSLWPSIRFRWKLIPGKLECFADSDMRSGLFSTRDAALKYRFNLTETMHYNEKTSNADFGFRGDIAEKLKWKLGAAYERIQNADVPLCVSAVTRIPVLVLLHEDNLEDFNFFLDLKARFGSFHFDGNVSYALYINKEQAHVLPSPLKARAEMGYDFLKRASVHVGADYACSYHVSPGSYQTFTLDELDVPDIVNLYAGADFSVSRLCSVFIEGANLLGRSCQYIPGISERGFSVTGGIVLNF